MMVNHNILFGRPNRPHYGLARPSAVRPSVRDWNSETKWRREKKHWLIRSRGHE